MCLFFLFALTLPWFTSLDYLGHEGSIYRALAFLIAASPCALIIATPTAYLSAISSCAKKGILLKGGVILDALARCSRIAFDKTGTLTTGDLQCTEWRQIYGSNDLDSMIAITAAATLEQHTTHPVAKAICSLAEGYGLPKLPLQNFHSHPGHGLEATILISDHFVPIAIGHSTFIGSKFPVVANAFDTITTKKESIRTFLYLQHPSGPILFVFSFEDAIRKEAADAVASLKKIPNFHIAMLTGDHQHHAHYIAQLLGIREVVANLRPEDKLAKVAEWAEEGLIMVGDGINDAPALARATVGISMGKIGSASAVEASDIVLVRDDLSVLSWLIVKSKKTLGVVRQNLFLALSVIFLASLPALLGLVPLWLAVTLHEGGTLLVGLNGLRLLKR